MKTLLYTHSVKTHKPLERSTLYVVLFPEGTVEEERSPSVNWPLSEPLPKRKRSHK